MLFIFCKEHPKLSYRQGMNEIIAPIFMLNVIQSTIQTVLAQKRREREEQIKKDEEQQKKKRKKKSNIN